MLYRMLKRNSCRPYTVVLNDGAQWVRPVHGCRADICWYQAWLLCSCAVNILFAGHLIKLFCKNRMSIKITTKAGITKL